MINELMCNYLQLTTLYVEINNEIIIIRENV